MQSFDEGRLAAGIGAAGEAKFTGSGRNSTTDSAGVAVEYLSA
jgi:hypothetical protein